LAHAKKNNVFSRENPPFLGILGDGPRQAATTYSEAPRRSAIRYGQWLLSTQKLSMNCLKGNIYRTAYIVSPNLNTYIGVSTSPFKDGKIINNNMVTSQARL
jgi:hypothetical protein